MARILFWIETLKELSFFVFQMHPLGLCNNNDEEDLYEYGWVGVVKLEQPELDPSCLTVLGKVRMPLNVDSSPVEWFCCLRLSYSTVQIVSPDLWNCCDVTW